jgi:hypothetical protein
MQVVDTRVDELGADPGAQAPRSDLNGARRRGPAGEEGPRHRRVGADFRIGVELEAHHQIPIIFHDGNLLRPFWRITVYPLDRVLEPRPRRSDFGVTVKTRVTLPPVSRQAGQNQRGACRWLGS